MPTANPSRIPSIGKPGIPPTPLDGGLNAVELTVVTEVVVVNVVELLVEEVIVVEVEVSVELMVAVTVAVCAGDVRGPGFAREGDATSMAIRKTTITPRVMASTSNSVDRLLVSSSAHFQVRLMTPTVARPRIIPARIDSHGNPGIPGTTRVLLLNTVEVSLVTLVVVEVDRELLVLVVASVMRLVEVDVVVVVALVDVVVIVDDAPPLVEVETIVVVPAPEPFPVPLTVGGLNGSRWKTPASGVVPVTPFGPAPTAHPSCVLPGCPYTE
jgi:hypothetical protein